MFKEVWLKQIIFDQMTAISTYASFSTWLVYAYIVPEGVDQLVLEFLILYLHNLDILSMCI